MTVKIFLMWNSKMLVDGGGDATVATSSLDASNLIVLKVCHLIPFPSLLMNLGCTHV